MAARVTIGEFATMTRLSRKALRLYHDLGLLVPVEVDRFTGYRYYGTDQIELARTIRHFRDLEMPVPELKAYVTAPDDDARTAIVSAHLDRMQDQLRQTQETVAALRELLAVPAQKPVIELRNEPALTAVAITEIVGLDGLAEWWTAAFEDLVRAAGDRINGRPGGFYAHDLFAEETGEATVWIPVSATAGSGPIEEAGRVRMIEIPAGRFAVATHDGPDSRIDETYAALGAYVAEHGIGTGGTGVRERYLAGAPGEPGPLVTEIAWPVLPAGFSDA